MLDGNSQSNGIWSPSEDDIAQYACLFTFDRETYLRDKKQSSS